MEFLTFDWLRWLATIELIGFAALPLAALLFKSFPDHGYGLSKSLGLLLIGFINWWLGSTIGAGNVPALLWLLAILLALGGLLLFNRQISPGAANERGAMRLAAHEEAIFLIAFAGWSFVRAINPDIHDSERPMDYMLLQVSGASHNFPPPDHWLAGYSVNYYYLGYTLFAMIGRMSLVAPRLGFNLSNITIFALGCTSAYALAVALTRRHRWGPAGVLSVMLAGNFQGLGQVLAQFKQGSYQTGISLWCSTRIIGGGCNTYTAITEFPIFSVIWGDLHPHLMALPFALLAIALAAHSIMDPPAIDPNRTVRSLRLCLAAVILGALFPLNSWDYPTYTVLVVLAMLVGLGRGHAVTARTLVATLMVVPVSLLAYAPYYATVHNATVIGFKLNPTPLNQVLAAIGGLLIAASLFVLWQGWVVLHGHQPISAGSGAAREHRSRLPYGWATRWPLVGAVLLLLIALPARTDLLYLVLLLLGGCVLLLPLRRAEPEMQTAVLLVVMGVLVLTLGDVAYVRDPSDHSPSYRLNTLFKLYYQAWLMLGVAAPYAIMRIQQALARHTWRFPLRVWSTTTIVLALGFATYPIEGIASQTRTLAVTPGLDGLLFVRNTDPAEYAAITWVLGHTRPSDVIAEGFGSNYWGTGTIRSANELTTLTGRQSIIAWPDGHETLWRDAFGPTPRAAAVRRMLEQREVDVTALYLSHSIQVATGIIHKYRIAYVYIGPFEWKAFSAQHSVEVAGFDKFRHFLTPVLEARGPTPETSATLYAVPPFLR